jgi:hypothetical protein
MRLDAGEPEWNRLLVESERGSGKHLSKLQAQITAGPITKPSTSMDRVYDIFEHFSDESEDVRLRNFPALKPKKASTRRRMSDNDTEVDSAGSSQYDSEGFDLPVSPLLRSP